MSNQKEENYNITVARETGQKFEFYFIALIFTILGLIVQTSAFSKEYYQYIFELLAWASLLTAGLAGLSRLEWVPIAYKQEGYLQIEERRLKAITLGLNGTSVINEDGEEWTQEELEKTKTELETHINKRKKVAKDINQKTSLKYKIQKYSFIIGIVSLIISRAILGLSKINI